MPNLLKFAFKIKLPEKQYHVTHHPHGFLQEVRPTDVTFHWFPLQGHQSNQALGVTIQHRKQ